MGAATGCGCKEVPYSGQFSGVQIFVKSCRGSSELIFVVFKFRDSRSGSMPTYLMGRR